MQVVPLFNSSTEQGFFNCLLRHVSSLIARHTCNDIPAEIMDLLSADDLKHMALAYEFANSKGRELTDDAEPHVTPYDYMWVWYLAEKIKGYSDVRQRWNVTFKVEPGLKFGTLHNVHPISQAAPVFIHPTPRVLPDGLFIDYQAYASNEVDAVAQAAQLHNAYCEVLPEFARLLGEYKASQPAQDQAN